MNFFGVLGLGRTYSKNEDIWLLFEPLSYKNAGIKVVAWTEIIIPPKIEEKIDDNNQKSDDSKDENSQDQVNLQEE